MRERADPDYILELRDLRAEEEPGVSRFLDGGWVVGINHLVKLVFVPYFPASPWPPPAPADLDNAADRDEAAHVVLATTTLLVAPTDGPARRDELTGDIPERQTVFWIPRDRYEEIDRELGAISRIADPTLVYPRQRRLSELDPLGALSDFLRNQLAAAESLSERYREILCLGAAG